MKLEFTAAITAADAETRTLTGQIVPFGKPGNTSAGPVIFETGSITNLSDPASIKLLMEHDHTRPVGRWISFEANPNGITGKAKVSATSAGNDLLVEAADGIRDGFSIGAEIDAHDIKNGVMRVRSARIIEISAVANPAFKDARITDVAASQPDEAEDNTTEGNTEMTEQVTPVEETTAPAVEASAAPVQAAAPIYTTPRTKGMSSGDYVMASLQAAAGSREAAILVKAADDDTSTNTGLTLPGHMQQFLTSTFGGRVTVAACGGARALPADGMSFTIPRMGTAPTVTAPGEGQAVSETGMTSDYITVTVARYAGMNTMSFELLERSAPAFGDLLLSELRKAYEQATDKAVIAALTSGGTQASTQAGTVAGLQAFIAKEGPAAYVATGGEFATELIADSEWWAALLAANDDVKRPLFTALQPMNAAGQAGIASPRGTAFGANLWVDPHIATSGLIDESAFLVAPNAVGIWESPTTQLRVNVLGTGQVEISLHGYLAVSVLKAGGVRRFNLT